MTEEMTPAAVPETPETPQVPETPETFVAAELVAARKGLLQLQIIGSLIVLAFSIYLITVTVTFTNYMKPDEAAGLVIGIATEQIDLHRGAFVEEVSTRVPALLQEVPDMAKKQIPVVREAVEAKLEAGLNQYADATREKLNANLDAYIAENKEAIEGVLKASNDPDAIETLGPTVREEVAAYLKETPADGPSIDEQIAESRKKLQDTEAMLKRLATARDLSPAEQQTRQAIAIIVRTVGKENLVPLPLPQLPGSEAE